METTNNLYQKLWSASDDLRNFMDANEYKNYLLGIIFYKYLSDKQLKKDSKLTRTRYRWLRANTSSLWRLPTNRGCWLTFRRTQIPRWLYYQSRVHFYKSSQGNKWGDFSAR